MKCRKGEIARLICTLGIEQTFCSRSSVRPGSKSFGHAFHRYNSCHVLNVVQIGFVYYPTPAPPVSLTSLNLLAANAPGHFNHRPALLGRLGWHPAAHAGYVEVSSGHAGLGGKSRSNSFVLGAAIGLGVFCWSLGLENSSGYKP